MPVFYSIDLNDAIPDEFKYSSGIFLKSEY